MTAKECYKLGVDFMDLNDGVTYKFQQAQRAKKLFNIDLPVDVVDGNGNVIGVVEVETLKEWAKEDE